MKYATTILLLILFAAIPASAQRASDDAIKRQIIEESIRSYRGSCPCPYNTMRNGAQCGGRSAYSKPGGASPICYPEQVTPAMLADYKKRKGL